jgi:hypothetical protein
MGKNTKTTDSKSRRWFLSLFTSSDKKTGKTEKIKMLTADGKLVEIDKSVLDEVAKKQKATNKDIYDWMKNPSKVNS